MKAARPAGGDAAAPGGRTVRWVSVDPRNHATVPYDDATSAAIEASFQAKKPTHELRFGSAVFTIIFGEMIQKNTTGGARKVARIVEGPMTPPPELTPDLVATTLAQIVEVDKVVALIEANEGDLSYHPPPRTFAIEPILAVFDHIIRAGLFSPEVKRKYGFNPTEDAFIQGLQYGDPVPSYFANVKDGQSIWQRKALSLLGLRNLVRFGLEIFTEMRAHYFSGNADDYAPKTGPAKMKHFTGNVVDLDSTILRAHEKDVVAAVNASQKANGLRVFKNGKDLAESVEGRQMVLSMAKTLIDAFVDRFKVPAALLAKRHLEMPTDPAKIPVATGNSDRGKSAVWLYNNVGLLTFHANVPNMSDVYGALLRAPYHAVKAWCVIHQQSGSRDSHAALDEAKAEYFEDCISDSCFNAKWKSIEGFLAARETFGGIDDELDKLQQRNQAVFTADFFAADDEEGTQELAAMVKLAADAALTGKDAKTGAVRPVTAADVERWHKARMGI